MAGKSKMHPERHGRHFMATFLIYLFIYCFSMRLVAVSICPGG